MKHIEEKWIPYFEPSVGQWVVRSLGGWNVFTVCKCLPGCEDGKATAHAICAEHNATVIAHERARADIAEYRELGRVAALARGISRLAKEIEEGLK